jgi:hypothetical protein
MKLDLQMEYDLNYCSINKFFTCISKNKLQRLYGINQMINILDCREKFQNVSRINFGSTVAACTVRKMGSSVIDETGRKFSVILFSMTDD